MGKYLKIKKMWKLVVSKPENHNLRRKTAIHIELDFIRKKKLSCLADTKLESDQFKRRMKAKFIKPFFIQMFLKVKTTLSFQAIT